MTILARSKKPDVTELEEDRPLPENGSDSPDEDNTEAAGGGEAEAAGGETEAGGGEAEAASGAQDETAVDLDRFLRLAAEYENFRKRSAKEREMTYTNARTDTITQLLTVYDNLERALKMECTDEAFYKGVEMIMTGLLEAFNNMGVKRIPAIGEPFDPNRHNAVMTIVDPELGEKIIAEEFQKGFMLGEKVIRFSTVVVAN